jgi:hypothetical protein
LSDGKSKIASPFRQHNGVQILIFLVYLCPYEPKAEDWEDRRVRVSDVKEKEKFRNNI